jgi:hypothetical protein
MKIKAKVTSDIVDLRRFGVEIVADALALALATPGKNLTAAMRMYAPTDTGALRDSIDFTIRNYPAKNKAVLIAGPKSRFSRGGRRPSKYAHLVEFGHIAVAPAKGTSRRKKTARGISFVPAKPFMRPAVEIFATYASTDFASEVEKQMTVKLQGLKGRQRIIL